MTEIKTATKSEARNEAKKISAANPGTYYTFSACFGLFLTGAKNLHRFAPTDAPAGLGYYYLNGKEKTFTNSQKIKDTLNTPVMS